MNYLEHNKEEHAEFKKIMEEIEKAEDGRTKRARFIELYASLYGHHEAEEEVIYPEIMEAIKKVEDLELSREMVEEHHLAMYQFQVVYETSASDETWDAKFSVLKEVLEHHMEEEETNFTEMAQKVLPKERYRELLEPFEAALEKYKEEKKKELQ
ncbi:hemerythrin domain-containing protein [Peptoniphilus sp. KCTC 25270]|uniref:hemerythrin domain-containing protein n=1 Tax=Peptoniphilus sp. KCTC 25270 TaxID=2897414 RepID=UPI001E3BD46D|nr:hemerythrin domain-containing protein [Peptoniphilus sp. KCTC 25270]MCD1147255.1 hemerythrin domain-containing protein [Peptoniphilus sp. KCTC 25270]